MCHVEQSLVGLCTMLWYDSHSTHGQEQHRYPILSKIKGKNCCHAVLSRLEEGVPAAIVMATITSGRSCRKGMPGMCVTARPRDVPAKNSGKMKPPRNPDSTVTLTVMSFTMAMTNSSTGVYWSCWKGSSPQTPPLGQMCGRAAEGAARVPISNSPQNMTGGSRTHDLEPII